MQQGISTVGTYRKISFAARVSLYDAPFVYSRSGGSREAQIGGDKCPKGDGRQTDKGGRLVLDELSEYVLEKIRRIWGGENCPKGDGRQRIRWPGGHLILDELREYVLERVGSPRNWRPSGVPFLTAAAFWFDHLDADRA